MDSLTLHREQLTMMDNDQWNHQTQTNYPQSNTGTSYTVPRTYFTAVKTGSTAQRGQTDLPLCMPPMQSGKGSCGTQLGHLQNYTN